MAKYHYRGPDLGLFAAQAGGNLAGRFLYRQADQFGLLNPDGSKTYYSGSGLVWDDIAGHFTAGTITAISHYDSSGAYVDHLTGLSITITALEPLLTAPASGEAASALQAALLSSNDRIWSNGGNDVLNGGAGQDIIDGGAGNDTLTGGTGPDILRGGDGRDMASYRTSTFGIAIDLKSGTGEGGDASGDTLRGIENVFGSHSADILDGDARANVLVGLGGADNLHGKGGNDKLIGSSGGDFLTGGNGVDVLIGGAGRDWIDGGTGEDIIFAGAGRDVIYGGPDWDIIVYDCSWDELKLRYDGSDYSIWADAPDGKDHVYAALTFATNDGTYRYNVPTATWVYESDMTGADWLHA